MKAGISACSNGMSQDWEKRFDELMTVLGARIAYICPDR